MPFQGISMTMTRFREPLGFLKINDTNEIHSEKRPVKNNLKFFTEENI